MDVNKNISEFLEIEGEIVEENNKPTEDTPIIKKANTTAFGANRDFNVVRQNLLDIIDKGNEAVDGILSVASEGESPRAYEVVSQLINTIASANKDLIDMHKKMKDIREDKSGNDTPTHVTNNSLYVGSTKELQDLIKQSTKALEFDDGGKK
tara:strand:+ start:307 stop:762 length:456 start_codon:yes stop_codon:yes gene_type:complete